MNDDLSQLYQKICDYSPDDSESRLKFTRRLARENGWTEDYSERVVEQYKRFMFLAVAAGHPVTPSEQVDQAWHLHLVYTRSYWHDFCGQVLGQQVHHGPTKGGSSELAKYRDWYECTKASYWRLLGDEPPADIWPDAHIRFGEDLQSVRVNWRRNWIIPKPSKQRLLLVGLGTFVLLAAIVVMFCGRGSVLPTESSEPFRKGGSVRTSMENPIDRIQYATFTAGDTYQRHEADRDHPNSATTATTATTLCLPFCRTAVLTLRRNGKRTVLVVGAVVEGVAVVEDAGETGDRSFNHSESCRFLSCVLRSSSKGSYSNANSVAN